MNNSRKMENIPSNQTVPPQVKPSSSPEPKTGGCIGRIKAPPSCNKYLQKESLSATQLSEFCFAQNESNPGRLPSFLDNEIETSWESVRNQILNCDVSRNGRQNQRFASDPLTGKQIRLTAGTVPVMNDGRILLCSSSRKNAWILPKGGWENDETLELSALRETFEEAGVLGTLGPKLNQVEYETRKGKKRRLQMEEQKKKKQAKQSAISSVVSTGSSCGVSSEDENKCVTAPSSESWSESVTVSSSVTVGNSSVPTEKLDDTASIASGSSLASDISSSCTHCRLDMSILYVCEAKDQWPESGRARKLVNIDDAIAMMSERPEFKTLLVEVKEKGYHLKHSEKSRVSMGCEEKNISQC